MHIKRKKTKMKQSVHTMLQAAIANLPNTKVHNTNCTCNKIPD